MLLTDKRTAALSAATVFAVTFCGWWYFGGLQSGAFVTGSGVPEANGVYAWATKSLVVQLPASVATAGSTRLPTLQDLLISEARAVSPVHRLPLSVIQQFNNRDGGVSWLIGSKKSVWYQGVAATGQPEYPPESGWAVDRNGVAPEPQLYLRGTRPEFAKPTSPPSKFWSSPFMTAVRTQPVNCAIILLCVRVWFYLRSRRWGWPEVGSSYRNVVLEGQVWRLITASFSHVDLMHLAMNMISLYQVGWLEQMYGSALYLIMSLMLVVLTMVVGLIIYHVLIHRFGKQHYVETIGVGYSCVLFALIVVATAQTPKYCPIPGIPDVCLPTWHVPVPLTGWTLPFNAAPFALLLAMHYIVPKASFVGHLAGIVMGYPLLWGGLDWFGLQLLVRFCAAAIVARAVWSVRRDAREAAAMMSGTASLNRGGHGVAELLGVRERGSRPRWLLLAVAFHAGVACLSLAIGTWSSVMCDVTAALFSWVAWRAAAGYGTNPAAAAAAAAAAAGAEAGGAAVAAQGMLPTPLSEVRVQVLLGAAAMFVVDAFSNLGRVGILMSSSGGFMAWTAGMVPATFMLAVVCVLAGVVVAAVAAHCTLQVVQQGCADGSDSPLWFLPAAMTPAIGAGAPPTSVVRNGVLLSRERERAARLAAVARASQRGDGTLSPTGRRLGTV